MSSKLKEARLDAGYSIEYVSLKLNIRKQYLIDLEEENFEAIPGQIYVEGYSKLYSEFLGIEKPVIESVKSKSNIKTKYKLRQIAKKRFSQKYFILASILLLTTLFSLYNYIKTKSKNQSSNYNYSIDFSTNSSDNKIDPNSNFAINNIEDTTKNIFRIFNNGNYITTPITNN